MTFRKKYWFSGRARNCPDDTATAGSWGLGRRRAGQLRFGFVAVLVVKIVYVTHYSKTRVYDSKLRVSTWWLQQKDIFCCSWQGYIVRFPQCSVFVIPSPIIGIRTLWLVSYSRYLWLSNIRQFCLLFFTSHICPNLGMTRYSDFFGTVQRTKWNISVFRRRLITNFKLCLVTLCTRDVGRNAFISGYHFFGVFEWY
jgi:hypothetical protein